MALPDGLLVCPICEHEARLPEEEEVVRIERIESRLRLLTVLGVASFGLGAASVLGYVVASEAHPEEPLFGVPLLAAAALLTLAGLVVTTLQEARAVRNSF